MTTILTVFAVFALLAIVVAIGFWLLRSQRAQQFELQDTEEEPIPMHPPVDELPVNYYGQTQLPPPRNMRSYQGAPAYRAPAPVAVRQPTVYVAPSGTVIHETHIHHDHDLLDPLNIISPLNPLSPISIWNQDEVRETPHYSDPVPAETPYEPSYSAPSYEAPSHPESSWGGGHSGGAGAGSSWDSPSDSHSSYSSSDSYSSSSYDSGSSSYDSGSSSCDTGSSGGGCD